MENKMNWNLEDNVNDWVKKELERIGLKNGNGSEHGKGFFNVESNMSQFLRRALDGSAKTINKTNFGKPDFHLEFHKVPVIIEDKIKLSKLVAETKDGIKTDEASNKNYAVNGALYYARNMIASEGANIDEVIAIGVAGDSEQNVKVSVYYVFGSGLEAYIEMSEYETLDFLKDKASFENFYKEALLTDEQKHNILISNRAKLQVYAGKLNKLMHNHNITAPQRVLYVSGMLLAMQDLNYKGSESLGIIPEFLNGDVLGVRDGQKIVQRIDTFLKLREIPEEKRRLMLASFNEISKDVDRDKPTKLDKEVAKFISGTASANRQIFTFIYEYIYKSIDGMSGSLDIMGEMYSEFLKYALGDGKEIGIVLTPPYVTEMMAKILNVNQDSQVMDLATGSAGFLIAAMNLMIADAESGGRKGSDEAELKKIHIKHHQLLGVELNAEMFTLASTNMILRGDGSSNIQKGNTFDTPAELYENFKADRLLLNPPFSFEENGMPFIAFGLDKMKRGGLAAIIIQDSAGSGKAVKTNQQMLKTHTLLASIKMPVDLFMPMAGVQTSIYVFEVGKAHDFDVPVKFIDFRNDGYKRTKRSLQELDVPTQRYQDIVKIYKAGKAAKDLQASWNLDEIFVEDQITNSGADWNFDQHKKIDTKPTFDDFRKTVADYLAWEVDQILKSEDSLGK
jgi:type I restriction-modification system DNA methylase subunit